MEKKNKIKNLHENWVSSKKQQQVYLGAAGMQVSGKFSILPQTMQIAATIASNKDGARKFGFLSIISPDVSLLQKNVYVRVFTTLPC